MDNGILKKRLSTFRSEGGSLKGVSDDLLVDILKAWESWSGTAKDFHMGLGLSKTQLGGLMGKAKKLRRDGHLAEGEFKEIRLESSSGGFSGSPCGIEISWSEGKIIRFAEVSQLVDFLKMVA
jgi:hypothetical protein